VLRTPWRPDASGLADRCRRPRPPHPAAVHRCVGAPAAELGRRRRPGAGLVVSAGLLVSSTRPTRPHLPGAQRLGPAPADHYLAPRRRRRGQRDRGDRPASLLRPHLRRSHRRRRALRAGARRWTRRDPRRPRARHVPRPVGQPRDARARDGGGRPLVPGAVGFGSLRRPPEHRWCGRDRCVPRPLRPDSDGPGSPGRPGRAPARRLRPFCELARAGKVRGGAPRRRRAGGGPVGGAQPRDVLADHTRVQRHRCGARPVPTAPRPTRGHSRDGGRRGVRTPQPPVGTSPRWAAEQLAAGRHYASSHEAALVGVAAERVGRLWGVVDPIAGAGSRP